MKRTLHLILLSCFMMTIICACGKKDTNNNLIITNRSSEIINNVAIQREGKTDVMGSELEPNEHCYFEMNIENNCIFKVDFENKNKQIIHSNEFTCDFSANKTVNIDILKDDNEKWKVVSSTSK